MTPITISLLTFMLALIGVSLGSFMQRVLPEGHLSCDSKEVVKPSMGGHRDPGRSCAWVIGRECEEHV
jgi:hypothetical protein